VDRFVRDALSSDGILLLRFISGYAGDLITTDLVVALFKDYVESRNTKRSKKQCELSTITNESEIVVHKKRYENRRYEKRERSERAMIAN